MKSRAIVYIVLIILSGVILSNIAPFLNTVCVFLFSVSGRILIVIGLFLLFAVKNEN